MQASLRTLLSAVAVLVSSALPAAAQTTAANTDAGNGPGLLFVWGWILIAGVIIFIVGTSMGVSSNKK